MIIAMADIYDFINPEWVTYHPFGVYVLLFVIYYNLNIPSGFKMPILKQYAFNKWTFILLVPLQ